MAPDIFNTDGTQVMPDAPDPKHRPHPWKAKHQPADSPHPPKLRTAATAATESSYAELQVTTNFTFLTGASHPDELVQQAAALDHHAVAITDTNTLAGVVRAHVAAKDASVPLVVGCRLVFTAPRDLTVLVYPTDRASYGRLCQLLTLGKRRAAKGECHLRLHDLLDHQSGLVAVVVPPAVLGMDFIEQLHGLRQVFDDDRLSIAASCLYDQDDRGRLDQIAAAAEHVGVPMVATNDVHFHVPERQMLQDIITCIRHGCTIEEAGFRLFANAERYLKPPQEMARLFADYPHALARTVQIADRAAAFNLDQLKYRYPSEVVPPNTTAIQHLAELTQTGAHWRYPGGIPEKVSRQIEHELRLIDQLNYAHYFLTVHDLIVFARSRQILCQGRGAAANSAVCYCLGVTSVDPDRIDVLFERFVSKERNEPPDIDIDFEHERREEVIQYIYGKYGRDRAALTAEVITYRKRSAVREVGKALGLSLDSVDQLAKSVDWWNDALQNSQLRELGLNPNDPTISQLIALTGELQGFPRHLSQHVGGFVITQDPLCELVPIENAAMEDRTVIEWDKDDIDAMGMLKVDVLGLGMLTCIRKTFELMERHHEVSLNLASVPPEDPVVYDMICQADTIGVFQIESRAQMSMLPRLRPRCYYDLVIEVAIVRPGPIQGQMVHPYLRRRNGEESIIYPSQEVQRVLSKTLGVPLFQEQVMSLAVVAAGFTPGEADQLRRAIAAWKSRGQNSILSFQQRFITGMLQRGYPKDFAQRCFEQIKGFGDYGFPESHAASFALLVYVSAWLKKHYPAAFACALLNSQPMGFYAAAQIVRDVKEHGIEVRPVDVNASGWDGTLEGREPALRLGMRQVKSLREDDACAIAQAVCRDGPFRSIEALWRASGVRVAALRHLAAADAFGSMGLDRQQALWHLRSLRDEVLPIFDQIERAAATEFAERHTPEPSALASGNSSAASDDRLSDLPDEQVVLPPIPQPRKVVRDYQTLGLSLKAQPVSFVREVLAQRGVTPAANLKDADKCPNGARIAVAGIVLVRQRPGTASGIIFMTIEDETGHANLIVRPKIYERDRQAARNSTLLLAHGHVERAGQVVHLLVNRLEDLGHELTELCVASRDFR